MARTDPVGWCQVTTELVILTRDESERRSSAQKQHGPPFEGSPRLALRTPKSLLSCGAQKDPPKEEIVRPLFGGPNCPRRLCSSSLRQFSHSPVDRKSTRLNSSHSQISYAVFCLKKKKYTSRIVAQMWVILNPRASASSLKLRRGMQAPPSFVSNARFCTAPPTTSVVTYTWCSTI